jgi:protein phosphatase PTC7
VQGVSVGVADGVGGWIESGIDPSLFSQALMYHSVRYAQATWAGEPEVDPTEGETRDQAGGLEMTPQELISSAYGAVLREKSIIAGACTFVLCH